MQKNMLTKKEIKTILHILSKTYPDARTELNYNSPFELLIAVILSAQCTDKRVNKITAVLFEKYNKAEDFLELSQGQLEEIIRSCGFYRNKSKNILETCRILCDQYQGEIPQNREDLMKLPGVGRKTANVVLSNVFGKDTIAVDTHVFRVSNRLGLAHAKDVWTTEKQLMKNIPQNLWSQAHHWLILHGRRICKARRPGCQKCPLSASCLYYRKDSLA